ncbi:MAG: stage II sporulation protein M [Candidatus Bathyarchaeota archaeon]|nr:stage II sporulation protein M [Candidatus Bathyarchaeota archaeon]
MLYCIKCGTRVPEDKESRFCPNCGAPLMPVAGYQQARLVTVEAQGKRRIATSKSRLLALAAAMVFCFAVTAAGAVARMELSEAQDIVQEMEGLEEVFAIAGLQIIFGNNLMHCLIMFAPFLGPIWGSYVLHSTGRVLAAVGSMAGADPLLLFITLFVSPHAWMEYVSYGLAISESFWLVYSAAKYRTKGFRNELTNASKAVAVCAVLLLLGAFAEMLLISSMPV